MVSFKNDNALCFWKAALFLYLQYLKFQLLWFFNSSKNKYFHLLYSGQSRKEKFVTEILDNGVLCILNTCISSFAPNIIFCFNIGTLWDEDFRDYFSTAPYYATVHTWNRTSGNSFLSQWNNTMFSFNLPNLRVSPLLKISCISCSGGLWIPSPETIVHVQPWEVLGPLLPSYSFLLGGEDGGFLHLDKWVISHLSEL